MKSYSLSTLFLVVTVASLILAVIFAWRQLHVARTELDAIRGEYGHIRVADETKIYVYRFINDDYRYDGHTTNDYFRIHIPDGTQYVLHLTDWPGNEWPDVDELVPTQTTSLPTQRGDVVITCAVLRQQAQQAPRVLVATESELLFDHVPQNWSGFWSGESWSFPDLGVTSDQVEFDAGDTIRFFRWYAENPEFDGIILWLEPREKWQLRRDAETLSTENGDTDSAVDGPVSKQPELP